MSSSLQDDKVQALQSNRRADNFTNERKTLKANLVDVDNLCAIGQHENQVVSLTTIGQLNIARRNRKLFPLKQRATSRRAVRNGSASRMATTVLCSSKAD